MSYKTILTYICDKCLVSTTFPETEQGPLFCVAGWLRCETQAYVYGKEDYTKDQPTRALYCPDCANKYGKITLLDHTSRLR